MTIVVGIIGAVVGVVGLLSSLSAADEADQLRRESQEKAAKYNLAKQQIAAQIQDRANAIHGVWTQYYLPCEIATVEEICSEPLVVANRGVVAQRAVGEMAKVFAVAKKAQQYCLPPQAVGLRMESDISLSIRQADMTAGLVRVAVQTEDARVALLNAQRMNDRMNIINPGRGHNASVTSALTAASSVYDGLAKETAKTIEDASYSVGRGVYGVISGAKEVLKASKSFSSPLQEQEQIKNDPQSQYKDAFERGALKERLDIRIKLGPSMDSEEG